jgi:hypothetical protein
VNGGRGQDLVGREGAYVTAANMSW